MRIEDFLTKLGLTLHPKKQFNISVRNGVDFLGVKVYYDYILPGKRIIHIFADKVYKIVVMMKGDCMNMITKYNKK